LKKTITPKAVRRTFQDLARAGEVKDIVTRAISGHATETMQHRYCPERRRPPRGRPDSLVGVTGFEPVTSTV